MAMLECRRVGHIFTDVINHRDTAMLMCRRVGNMVTDVNVYRVTVIIDVSDNVTDTATC